MTLTFGNEAIAIENLGGEIFFHSEDKLRWQFREYLLYKVDQMKKNVRKKGQKSSEKRQKSGWLAVRLVKFFENCSGQRPSQE